ncbi:MAG: Ribose ABC transport system, periplasmic ribose-binding protein RbsB, partial [uncultured Gemmatimonadetes bacterium]
AAAAPSSYPPARGAAARARARDAGRLPEEGGRRQVHGGLLADGTRQPLAHGADEEPARRGAEARLRAGGHRRAGPDGEAGGRRGGPDRAARGRDPPGPARVRGAGARAAGGARRQHPRGPGGPRGGGDGGRGLRDLPGLQLRGAGEARGRVAGEGDGRQRGDRGADRHPRLLRGRRPRQGLPRGDRAAPWDEDPGLADGRVLPRQRAAGDAEHRAVARPPDHGRIRPQRRDGSRRHPGTEGLGPQTGRRRQDRLHRRPARGPRSDPARRAGRHRGEQPPLRPHRLRNHRADPQGPAGPDQEADHRPLLRPEQRGAVCRGCVL